jgi:hypothetical protein
MSSVWRAADLRKAAPRPPLTPERVLAWLRAK